MERIQNGAAIFHRSFVDRIHLSHLLLNGREDLLAENIMNVVVFIPVGLLLSIAFKQVTWWKALLIGCCFSVTIEALQFFLMRGFSELDDVMHNTLGCLIGWCMVKSSRLMVQGCQNLLKM